MSDSQEKSDDLIAELAKLMASNAGGTPEGSKPTVIKLPPLNEATVKANPVRIPGMEPPRAAAEAPRPVPPVQPATSAPTIRIPGMEKPAGIDAPPAPKPAAQFDFGKPPSPPPVFKPEPMSNWQTREPPKLSPEPPPRPAAVAHLAELKFDPVKPAGQQAAAPQGAARPEANPAVAAPAPQTRPSPQAPTQTAGKSSTSDGFGFDFGFGKGSQGQPQTPPVPANDPIADLITAELDAAAPAKLPHTPQTPPAGDVLPNPIPPRPAAASAPGAKPVAASASAIRPVNVMPRAVDGDRFTVAPILGGQKPPSPPPAQLQPEPTASRRNEPALDPIEEIENLIGEAVRVELEVGEKPASAAAPEPEAKPAAPVVPPLGSAFGPRRANMRDREPPIESAEAAILAAAAASGSEVNRVDAPAGDERPYKRMKVKPPRTSVISSGARQYVGIAVAGTLLLAAGFGLYWVLGMGGRDDPATAPVLTADAGPVKVEPTISEASAAEPSGSVVFDEINGNTTIDNGETLVSRDETAGASPTEVARAVTPAAEETGETGLANRKVRTVTVRPDGTIVSGDEAVAGTEALPVARPNVPDLPGEDLEPSDLLTAAVETRGPAASTGSDADSGASADTADAISALVSETGEASTTPLPEPEPLEVAAVEPANTTPAVFDASLVAPIPMPRPADRASMVGGASAVREANAAAALPPAQLPLVDLTDDSPAATSAVSSGSGAYVQLSSQKTEADAQASLRATQNRMSSVLNGATLEIRRVDLGAKGVWYRVVLPRDSFQDATQTCAAIKSNGWDCVAIGG